MTIIQKNSFRGMTAISILMLAQLFIAGCGQETVSNTQSDTSLAESEQLLIFERQLEYIQAHEDMVEANMDNTLSLSVTAPSPVPAKSAVAADKWLELMRELEANTVGYAIDGPHGELTFSTAKDATIHIVQNKDTGKLEMMKFSDTGLPIFHGVLVPCHDDSAQKSLCDLEQAKGQSTRSPWDSPESTHYHYAVLNANNRRYDTSQAVATLEVA